MKMISIIYPFYHYPPATKTGKGTIVPYTTKMKSYSRCKYNSSANVLLKPNKEAILNHLYNTTSPYGQALLNNG